MSSSIWTRCAGDSELRPLDVSPWRVVEAQHQVSTRKLVDSNDEVKKGQIMAKRATDWEWEFSCLCHAPRLRSSRTRPRTQWQCGGAVGKRHRVSSISTRSRPKTHESPMATLLLSSQRRLNQQGG